MRNEMPIAFDPSSTAQRAKQQAPKGLPSFAETLLSFENDVRDLENEKELLAHCTNATRRLLAYRQAILFKRRTVSSPYQADVVSSMAVVDRNSPFVRWIEGVVNRLHEDAVTGEAVVFTLPAYCDEKDEETSTHPFPELCWAPFKDGEEIFGGLLVAREKPWNNSERLLTSRLARLYAHAWRSLKGKNRTLRSRVFTKPTGLIAAVVIALIALLPVHITALAPVEVMPSEPFVVAAPFSGVVKEILVEQNSPVSIGQPLVKFEDVHLRNEYELADQNEAVAQARYLRASQGAIRDTDARHELLIAKSELELAHAEKSYAKELLTKSEVMSQTQGLAVYTDKRDWIGRPVAAGEAILQIANPERVQLEIDLAVKDSIVLKEDAQVQVFLDSDPLNPLEARLVHASYQARVDKRNIMSYRIVAALTEGRKHPPRIGIQGTAQIRSEKAPLIYNILRRPLSSLRQFTGW